MLRHQKRNANDVLAEQNASQRIRWTEMCTKARNSAGTDEKV